MKDRNRSGYLRFEDNEILQLRNLLRRVGFTEEGILHHFNRPGSIGFGSHEIPWVLRMTRRKQPLDVFIRLFLCNQSMDPESVESAFFPLSPERLCEVGLLCRGGRGVRSRLRLMPIKGLFIGCDATPPGAGKPQRSDHIHGPGFSSITLRDATVRLPFRSALDLGTGCGVQAMVCASHSRHVLASDINGRALAIARFNASLNQLTNIAFARGYGFAPVKKRRFDLIVSNPPFAISPEVTFVYRDSGMRGDDFVRQLVETAPSHLTDGGYCQMMAQWAHVRGQPVEERLREWVAGKGCDAWFLTLDTTSKENYVSNWLSETETHDPEGLNRRWEAWVRYLDKLAIEGISLGVITLRKTDRAKPWFWVNTDAKKLDEAGGAAVADGFRLRDFLEATTETERLDTRFRISPTARLERSNRSDGEGWAASSMALMQTRGIHYAGTLDELMAQLIGRCNGKRPLIQLVDELAVSLDTERSALIPSVLDITEGLIQRGFLLPPELGANPLDPVRKG